MLTTNPATTSSRPARHATTTPPYGLQRDMMQFAERDPDGTPRAHRYGSVAELVRISGPLDLDLLAAAIERAAADMDTLGGRFVHRDGRDLFVFDPGRRRVSHALVTALGQVPDPAKPAGSGVAETLRLAANQGRHLQEDPPMHVLAARLGDEDHLLLLTMDHSVSDGRTLVLVLRQISRHYEHLRRGDQGTAPAPLPGFWDFAHRVIPARRERFRSQEYWSKALLRAADRRGRPHFPGEVHAARWPAGETARVNQAAAAYGVPAHLFILAAYSLATAAWSDGFVAVNYMRNGRQDRTAVNVVGPLSEHAVTVQLEGRGSARTRGLADHLGAWAARNHASPPYYGLTQRELETLESEENRLLIYNFLPAIPPLRFGAGEAVHDPALCGCS